MSDHTSRGPSPALIVSILALLVALSGTAYAASLPKNSVGAAQLKKNAVTSKAVDNGSLKAKDVKKGQLGQRVFIKNVGSDSVDVTAVVGNPETVVSTMALPKGTYYVRASGYAFNTHAALVAELRCYLRTSGNVLVAGTPGLYVPIEPDAGTNNDRGFFTLDIAVKLKKSGNVRVECSKGAAAQTMEAGASITAVETAKATAVP